jgi:drug/metabolite transporter (DMT)-like permease
MSWQVFITLSVLLFSINGLLHRVMMKDELSDAYAQTVAFNALVGVFAFIIILFRGGLQPFFTINQFILFLPLVIFGIIGTICAFSALKLIEASENTILLTSSKLWLIITSLIFLQESFSIVKIIGALLIISGVIIAQWRKGTFVLNTGAIYALVAAFCYACSDTLSFYILRNYDATSLIIYATVFGTIGLIIIRPSIIGKLAFYKKPRRALNIIIVSINDTLASLFTFLAYQVGRNALQIGPLGATQTIVTVILALIVLKETDNMPQKITGALITVFGTILVLL